MGNATRFARKIGALSGLILLGGIVGAQAACPAPDTLKATSVDRRFVQEKYLSGMEQPLRSEGRMTATDDEIVWHMIKPFDVRTVISEEGITQSVSGGDEQPVAAGTGQIAGSVARSMAAVMRGEWDALEGVFDVDMSGAKGGEAAKEWVVGLTPHDDRLKAIMGKIVVRGCKDVSTVDFGAADGDREHIQFDPAGF